MAQLKDLIVTGASRFIGDLYGTNAEFQGDILPTADNTYNIGSVLKHWKEIYANDFHGNADSADRLNDDAGSGINPIYFANGVPVASASTVGTTTKPVFLNAGIITASDATVGTSKKPVYMSGGVITPSDATVGSSKKPVYMSSGTITASNATVGSSIKPIFMSSGTITASSGNVGNETTFAYMKAGELVISSTTVGGNAQPVYMGSGEILACEASVGASDIPVFMSGGVITASTSTIGSSTKPIYMSAGTITESNASIGGEKIPVYLKEGVITASTSTEGSSTQPVYLNAGTTTAITKVGTAYGGTGHTSYTANQLIYTMSTTEFSSAGELYTTGANLGIGATTATVNGVAYTLYVNGTTYLGGATTVNGAALFQGGVTFSNTSFNYSGIENATANAARNIWFSDSGTRGKPCYNDKITYNPSTDELKAGNFAGSGTGLTNLNASNLTSGTIGNGRLPARLKEYASDSTTLNDIHASGFYYAAGLTSTTNPFYSISGKTDMQVFSLGYSAIWGTQIASDFYSDGLAFRRMNGSAWQSWRTIIHSGNYTDYTIDVNGANATNTTSIYAPTSAGTANQVLKSNGSGAPSWMNQSDITVGSCTAAEKIRIYNASEGTTTKYYVTGVTETGATGATTGGVGAMVYRGNAIYMQKGVLYGAAWNDYAEYREVNTVEPGRCVCENGDDTLSLSTERLQPGGNIVSDTFGFVIGETEKAKTPLAVSGRVLAYTYEDRKVFKAGDAVCAAPNGTVSKMTREEIREWPDRIIGYVSSIPTYEVWGEGNVKVNGRIWIKVK